MLIDEWMKACSYFRYFVYNFYLKVFSFAAHNLERIVQPQPQQQQWQQQ